MSVMKLTLLAVVAGAASAAWSIKPVSELDVNSYLGRWYQVRSNPLVLLTQTGICSQADYSLNPNGTIGVWNRNRVGSVQGPVQGIRGYAVKPSPTTAPGELVVYLAGVPFPGTYNVYALGPRGEGGGGEYAYAVVSEPRQTSLYVLARNVTEYFEEYDAGVMALLTAQGFTGLNAPIRTVQEGCPPLPLPPREGGGVRGGAAGGEGAAGCS